MGSLVTTLLSGGIEGAGKGIASVVDAIKGKSPEDAAKLAQIAADLEELKLKYPAELAQAQMAENVQLNATAGENIRADAASGDKFTVRARPSVIWMGTVLIFWNYGIVPVFGHKWAMQAVVLPDAFWWTWGTVVTGYVFNRTMEKIAQMPGDSQVNVMGLLKAGNKS